MLLGVLAALLLKFRVASTSEVETSNIGNLSEDFLQTTWAITPNAEDNAYAWAKLLGYKTGSYEGLPSDTGDTKSLVENIGQPSLLEQNRVAIPLGVGIFAISVFVLGSSTYGYYRTHMQLAKGNAFAGSWRCVGIRRAANWA